MTAEASSTHEKERRHSPDRILGGNVLCAASSNEPLAFREGTSFIPSHATQNFFRREGKLTFAESTSTLVKVTCVCCRESLSYTGAICPASRQQQNTPFDNAREEEKRTVRQGPHHSAEKSITSRPFLARRVSSWERELRTVMDILTKGENWGA